jgi:hypothetical protein
MDRAWKSGASVTPPVHTELTAGNYPTVGNPGTGTAATKPGAYWYHMVTEELRGVIAAAGLTPDKSDVTQLLTALKTFGLLGGVGGGGIGQLKFPAVQNPSSDSNTLDDFERGSWLPIIGGAGGTSGQTYGSQIGRYLKIGRFVWASGFATLTAKGTITGNVQIQGLPFASENVGLQPLGIVTWNSLATNWVYMTAFVNANATNAELRGAAAAAGNSNTPLVTADIGATSSFNLNICYTAAQ